MRQAAVVGLLCADGSDWREGSEQAVAGVAYKAADGTVQRAFAHLTVACDGMHSLLRGRLHQQSHSFKHAPNYRHNPAYCTPMCGPLDILFGF